MIQSYSASMPDTLQMQRVGYFEIFRAGDSNGDGRSDILARATSGYWHAAESKEGGAADRRVVHWAEDADGAYVLAASDGSPRKPAENEVAPSDVAAESSTSAETFNQQAVDDCATGDRGVFDIEPSVGPGIGGSIRDAFDVSHCQLLSTHSEGALRVRNSVLKEEGRRVMAHSK